MPNELADFHRKKFPGDKRSDEELTVFYTGKFGQQWAETKGRQLPNFYRDYRRAFYGDESEFGKGLERGVRGLQSTAMGGIGLALDAVPGEIGFVEDAKRSALKAATEYGQQASDPKLAPVEPEFKNVETIGQAADYAGALFGEAAPSIVESVAVGAAGALAGSAAAPGPGTIAGGLTGIVGKAAAKKVLKDAVAEKLGDLTGDQVKNALAKKASKEVTQQVDNLISRRARSMMAGRGSIVANALNSYGLSSGEIYNELANDPEVDPDDAFNISLTFGAVAAAPDTILPNLVLKRMGVFDRIAGVKGTKVTKKDTNAFQRYLTRALPTAAQATGIEAATEGFQELVNIAAGKYAKDEEFKLSDAEVGQIQRAMALGAAGGFMVSPLAAVNVRDEADNFTTETTDPVVAEDEEGRPVREVDTRKPLVIPTPVAAAPLPADVDARLSELALKYLQGEITQDPDLSKEYIEAKKDPAKRKRLLELLGDFKRQIQLETLKEDKLKFQFAEQEQQAERSERKPYIDTLIKVLENQPLDEQDVANVEARGGSTVSYGEGEVFGAALPETATDEETTEDVGEALDEKSDPEPEPEVETKEPAEETAPKEKPGDIRKTPEYKQAVNEAKEAARTTGRLTMGATFDEAINEISQDKSLKEAVNNVNSVVEPSSDYVGEWPSSATSSYTITKQTYSPEQLEKVEAFQDTKDDKVDQLSKEEIREPILIYRDADDGKERVVNGNHRRRAAIKAGKDLDVVVYYIDDSLPPGVIQTEGFLSPAPQPVIEVEPEAEAEPAEVIEAPYDYGKLNPFVETVKNAPAEPIANVNKFIENDIKAKEIAIEDLSKKQEEASEKLTALRNIFSGQPAPQETTSDSDKAKSARNELQRIEAKTKKLQDDLASEQSGLQEEQAGENNEKFIKGFERRIAELETKIEKNESIAEKVQARIDELQGAEPAAEQQQQTIQPDVDPDELIANIRKLEDRINQFSSQISIQQKRIEKLREGLIEEDTFIDADSGQVVTAAALNEDSFAYEESIPLMVEQQEETKVGEVEISYKNLDKRLEGGQPAPAYYDIDPESVEDLQQALLELGLEGQRVNEMESAPALDAQSVTKDAAGKARASNDVRRLTAFYNKETGEVFVLGTGRQRRGKDQGQVVFFVNRGAGKKGYMTMQEIADEGSLIPFASMRLISPRSKPSFYYADLNAYAEAVGDARTRSSEARTAQARTAANIQVGDVDTSLQSEVATTAAIQDAVDQKLLLSDPELIGNIYDELTIDGHIGFANRELLVELGVLIIVQNEGAQSLIDAGVAIDNLEEINNYVARRWVDQFEKVLKLANETTDPKRNFISRLQESLSGSTGVAPEGESRQLGESAEDSQGRDNDEGATRQREKFSQRERLDPGSPSDAQTKAQFVAALQSLATAGVQVQALETTLNEQMGMYDDRAIQLIIPDLANPTKDNVRLLLHEAGHALFELLPIKMQEAFHKSMRRLSDEELQVDTDRLSHNIAPDNPIDETTQEERLVESVAKELADAGFDAADAPSLVRQVLNWLRQLYIRSYVAVQQALLGAEHVNPEMARQYFKLRLESYLTKNYTDDAITFMGGAPLTAEQIGKLKRNDRSDVTKLYDFTTGEVELTEIESETLDDVMWNSRRRVKFSEDGTVEEATIDPAPELSRVKVVQDYIQQTYEEMFLMWNEAGLNMDGVGLDDFIKKTLKHKGELPETTIEKLIEKGADPEATLDSLEETSARPRAAKAIYLQLRRMKSRFESIRGEAFSDKNNSSIDRAKKIAERVKEFQDKYTDLNAYTKNIVGIIDQALKEYARETKSTKPHLIARILKKLDPKYKYKNYKADLEKARKRALDIEDVLDAIGKMDLDFTNVDLSTDSITDLAVEIRDNLGATTLGSKVQDNTVIASILGFAKRYPEAMTLLQLRGERNRSKIDQAMRLMMSDNAGGLTEARRLIRESITKTRQAERLLDKINDRKKRIRKILTKQDNLTKQVDALETVEPLIDQRVEEVSSIFGAELGADGIQWEPMHSTFFFVPPSPTASLEEIFQKNNDGEFVNTREVKLTPEGDFGQITKIIQMQTEWLQVNGDTGAQKALIKRQRDGLIEIQADFTQHQLRQNVVTNLVSDRATKLEGIGGPLAKQIARRDRKFVALLNSYGGQLTSQKGVAWATAEKEAIKATGSKSVEEFMDRFYAPFFTYAAEHLDILEAFPGNYKAAEKALLRRAKIFMSARTNGESDKAWPALTKLYQITASRNGYANEMREKMGVKVLEEVKIGSGKPKKFFRETIGSPMFSLMRRTKDNTEYLYDHMRVNWGNTKPKKLKATIDELAAEGPEALIENFAGMFDERTVAEFVEPIINRSVGSFPSTGDTDMFEPAEIQEAWAATAGLEGDERVVQFAYKLADNVVKVDDKLVSEGITPEDQYAETVAGILKVFPQYYGQLRSLFNKKDANKRQGNPTPVHTMMDARVAQNFPSEWLDYSTYTEREMRYYAESLAYEAAYGRDLVGVYSDFDQLIKVLGDRANKYTEISSDVTNDPSIKPAQRLAEIKKRANAAEGYRLMKGAAKDLSTAQAEYSRFKSILKNKSEQLDYNATMELVSALSGATVQGMSTAITDMSTAFEGPFRTFGISNYGMSALFKNIKYTGLEAIGTLIQLLPVNWNVNAERVKRRTRLGLVDDDALVSFRDRYVSNMQDEFRSSKFSGKAMETVSRAIRTVLQSGLGKAKKADQIYTTLKAAPFTMFVNWQTAGTTDSMFDVFTDFVGRAGEFFANNPDKMADPNYQLTANDLGMQDKLMGLVQNEKAFNYIVNTLQQHGLNPTRLGREYVLNGKKNPLNDEHYRRISALSATEVMLENTAVSTPSWMMSNFAGMLARPLVRWGFIKTGKLASQLPSIADSETLNIKDENTRKALKAYKDFAIAMGMAIIPISLAWAMLRDKYDEEALGKRGNLMRFGEGDPFLVMLDRLDRVGTFGMAGEVANTMLNMNTAREFGVDNRIFAINSALSLGRAVSTWIRQGEATYATVYRPALSAAGFAGALQNFQLANNLLGADNFESRYAARINVNNILRSSGRQLGFDVRKFSGGGALPTPMKPHLSEMVLSAYANDGVAFRQAYNDALLAAKAMGKEDPEKSVKASFTMYHPLRYVFRTPPLKSEFNRLLGASGSGRQAINESIMLFNKYGQLLDINPYMGKAEKKSSSAFEMPKTPRAPRIDYRALSVDSDSLVMPNLVR